MPKGVYARPTLAERLWCNTKRTEAGCLEWLGPFCPKGYGHISKRFGNSKRTWRTHRLAYELTHGVIAAGLIVRHKCDNPPCIEPKHLELGTHADNSRDRDSRGRNYWSNLTHCPQGHLYDTVNTYYPPTGSRKCRTCNRDRARVRKAAYRQLEVRR